tara:strand:+ start:2828 stop:3613 length:786 start_codon:yes stop_codon:yes gene_type:complete
MKIFYILFLFLLPATASAQTAQPLKVTYGLYASGFRVAVVDAVYDLSETGYGINADLDTAGMLATLAPWNGVIETTGRIAEGRLIPQSHEFANTWRDETKTNTFKFDKNGKLIAFTEEKTGEPLEDKMPPEEVYADNPVDMLTALMNAMRGQTCATTQKVMDGKRRFDIVFRSKGEETLKANNYNRYNGSAEICEIEIVPVAGKWREKPRGWMNIQEQAKTKGQLPRMWFGKVKDNAPAIPVRMMIRTSYGTMLLHLENVQ